MKNKIGLLLGIALSSSLVAHSQVQVTPQMSPYTVSTTNFNPLGYVVQSGAQMIINSNGVPIPTYDFLADHGIHVETGGDLIIYKGELTCSSGTGSWNGITIDAEATSNPNHVLTVHARPSTTFSNAKTAIHCKSTTTGGGYGYAADIRLIAAPDLIFAENLYHDILIQNEFDPGNPKVNYSIFETSSSTNFSFQGTGSPDFVANFKIEHTNMVNDFAHLDFNSPNFGVHLNNSHLDLEQSAFNRMRVAVHDENYQNISGSFFDQNIFNGPTKGCYLDNSFDFSLHNNDIINVHEVFQESNSESTLVMGNRVTGCTGYLYFGVSNNNSEIQGNVFNYSGIGSTAAFTDAISNNTAIRGNQFYGDLSANPPVATAIYFGYTQNALFRGNLVKDFASRHILVDDSYTTTICSNTFHTPTQTCIQINGPMQDQGTPSLGSNNKFLLSNGETRVLASNPITFHNTNFIPLADQINNNTWSTNASHVYVSTSELCATTKQVNVEEVTTPNTILSPNPFTDVLYLDNIDHIKEIRVFSMDGKLVRHISEVSNEIYFDNLDAGTYFIHLIDQNNQPDVQKVIKL